MTGTKTVLIAKSVSDVLYHLKSVSGIQIICGATATPEFKEKTLTIFSIPELAQIEKRERYIDIGPAVTISKIMAMGRTKMPAVLYDSLNTIGTEGLRNIATIGGNICARKYYHTLYAPLLALNARLEFKGQNETRYIPFSKFTEVPQKFFLSKIRIPHETWDIEIFKRVGQSMTLSDLTASFAFLAKTQHGIIISIRIVFAGKILFNSQELENKIIGTHLPISAKFIDSLIEEAERIYLSDESRRNAPHILKAQFLNLMRNSLEQLT